MLYDSKMMKSFPQSFAFFDAPSFQAASDAPGPAPRAAGRLAAAGCRAGMTFHFAS
jgi:hypothetical protein